MEDLKNELRRSKDAILFVQGEIKRAQSLAHDLDCKKVVTSLDFIINRLEDMEFDLLVIKQAVEAGDDL